MQPNKKFTNEKGQFLTLKNVEEMLLSASFFDSHIVFTNMNILPNSPIKIKSINYLRLARAEAFLEYLVLEQCAVFLDKDVYEHWHKKGWSKEDVENAINDLVARQIISVSSFLRGEITMGLIEPSDFQASNGGKL